MDDLKTSFASLKQHATDYSKTYVQLAKAKATASASTAAAGAAIGIAALVFGLFFLAFLFTGIAWLLGSAIGSNAGGFFIVAAFFALLLVLVFMLRKKVIVPWIRNTIISKAYEQEN